MATDEKVQRGAERLLEDIRKIKASLAEEGDPEEQRRLRRLLKGIRRKISGHRAWLERLLNDARAGSDLRHRLLYSSCSSTSAGSMSRASGPA
jgi:hypothetical protein